MTECGWGGVVKGGQGCIKLVIMNTIACLLTHLGVLTAVVNDPLKLCSAVHLIMGW